MWEKPKGSSLELVLPTENKGRGKGQPLADGKEHKQ